MRYLVSQAKAKLGPMCVVRNFLRSRDLTGIVCGCMSSDSLIECCKDAVVSALQNWT